MSYRGTATESDLSHREWFRITLFNLAYGIILGIGFTRIYYGL